MVVFDNHIIACICREERGFAHQFADEGAAHPLCLVNQLWQAFKMECQTLPIEVKEPLPAGTIW